MSSQRTMCPHCKTMVKESNIAYHLHKVHGISPRESFRKIESVVLVMMIIAVALFGVYWVALRDDSSTADQSGSGDSPLSPETSLLEPDTQTPGTTPPATGSDPDTGDDDVVYATISVHGYAQDIVLALYPDRAPNTVDNFVKYANDGFYDGLIFHRVIEDFMIQGGGFHPDLTQKATTYPPIVNEASVSRMRNNRGAIAMARTSDPNSATSQFYINHADNNFLDWDQASDGHGYCVFGVVVEGMSMVDAIAGVPTSTQGGMADVPVEDVIITSILIGT